MASYFHNLWDLKKEKDTNTVSRTVKEFEDAGFNKEKYGRFVITKFFEDYFMERFNELNSKMGDNYFLYSAFKHDEGYSCIKEKQSIKRNNVVLMLDICQP